MKFLGDTKAESIAHTHVNWLILLQGLQSPTLHCTLISYIRASLVAQMVKRQPAMRETQV